MMESGEMQVVSTSGCIFHQTVCVAGYPLLIPVIEIILIALLTRVLSV